MTVGPDFAVVHEGTEVRRYDGLEPDAPQQVEGFTFRTLPVPGERLATFATVNDVHFGETECGVIDGSDLGPTFRVEPGETPYPEVMNRGAVEAIARIDPDVVLVKGDLTSDGSQAQIDAFTRCYQDTFGDRLYYIRGNHESWNHQLFGAVPYQEIAVDGATLAMLDTSVDGAEYGGLSNDQLVWLDELASRADWPVLVFGHHHCWDPGSKERPERYFGINTLDSEQLVRIVAGRPSIAGCFAGHTHRNRVRRFATTGDVPWVEVACVKDYPGAWAEYRIHERGVLQIEHRISSSDALVWTEKTRHMYAGLYHDYAFGSLDDRCFAILGR
jgi:predicted phosphodiesterase